MFKVNDKTPEKHLWCCSGVFIVDFEHSSVSTVDFEQVNVYWGRYNIKILPTKVRLSIKMPGHENASYNFHLLNHCFFKKKLFFFIMLASISDWNTHAL